MNALKVGITNESKKLIKRSKYKILLVCFAILSLIIGIISKFTSGIINISLSNIPLNILSIMTTILIPLVIFMAVADLFTAEQENGTIKAIITRPISRIEILFSKMISILLYVICILIVTYIISLVMGMVTGKTQIINIPEITLAYVVSIIPAIPTIFLSILVSQFSRSSSSSVMLSVLIYIIIILLGLIFPAISSMIFSSYTNWYKLFIGAQMPIKSIFTIIGLQLGYALVFFAGAYALFEKKEY